jgi:type IV pilus assembly protein PilE
MVVVVIIGVLAAVAIPSYTDYVRRGQLPEAFGALADYRVKMEQYYQDNRSYGGAGGCADGNGTTAPGWSNFIPSNQQYFSYKCGLSNNGQGYKITATGIGGQVGPSTVSGRLHVYTIDDANARATTSFKGATVSASCWLTSSAAC